MAQAVPLPPFPMINGKFHDWSSVEVTFETAAATLKIILIKSLNYKGELAPTAVQSTSPKPAGFTRGVWTADGDIEISLDAFYAITSTLGAGWMEVPVTIKASYSEGDRTYTDTIFCRLSSAEASQAFGGEALTRKCALKAITDILYNGASAVNDSLSTS